MTTVEGQEVRLTREELYERVWSEPMATLAPQFGISDVALKKTCTKMRVPTPYRGYWAKKSAGATPRRVPLPKLPISIDPSKLTAQFGRPPKPTKEEVAAATGPVADQARFEALPEHRITVPEVLSAPHPLVATSVHLLRKAKPDAQHVLASRGKRCLALSVTMGTVDRAMCIYDALIKALETRGYPVEIRDAGETSATVVAVGDERISVAIEERVDRVERKPDPRKSYERPSYYGPEYDYVPTGRLTLRILHDYLGVRRSWADGTRQRADACLNDFIIGLVAAAEALRTQRLEREARQREWEAEEERRRRAERQRQEEASRVRALDASLSAWRKSVMVREFVQAMRSSAEAAGLLGEDEAITQWLKWAEEYADRIDPTHASPTVPADPEPHHWSGYYNAYERSRSEEPRALW